MKHSFLLISVFGLMLLLQSCQKDDEQLTTEIPEFAYSGGSTTIFDATSNAFATPAPNLSPVNFDRHLDGDLAFEQVFVTSPSDVNAGLGPVFNNNSCVSCHVRNGRSASSIDGNVLSGFLLRISVTGESSIGGPQPVPNFGTQLQTRAIYGQTKEGSFTTDEVQEIVTFLDGTTKTISKNVYHITEPYQPLPTDLMISPRVAPAVFGLGLLEAIPETDIMMLADEADVNNDGISGKPNIVWNAETQTTSLGRFGWKAEIPTARQQAADAYHQDMGVTNSLFAVESCAGQPDCIDDTDEIDISDEVLDATTFYFQTLAVPAVRNYDREEVLLGKRIFEKLTCNGCHVSSHITGDAIIPELSNQTIFPYTDLLLHDMGEGLADNRPSFAANGKEWRTAPLWGIGLLEVVNGHSALLHDGRARNIEEAILWHGGEAQRAKEGYTNLTATEREQLLSFLKSL